RRGAINGVVGDARADEANYNYLNLMEAGCPVWISAESERHRFTQEAGDANKKALNVDHMIQKVKIWSGAKAGEPKILCSTSVRKKNHGAVVEQARLWGRRCDQYFVFTDDTSVPGVPDTNVVPLSPLGGEKATSGWQLFRASLKFLTAWQHISSY